MISASLRSFFRLQVKRIALQARRRSWRLEKESAGEMYMLADCWNDPRTAGVGRAQTAFAANPSTARPSDRADRARETPRRHLAPMKAGSEGCSAPSGDVRRRPRSVERTGGGGLPTVEESSLMMAWLRRTCFPFSQADTAECACTFCRFRSNVHV